MNSEIIINIVSQWVVVIVVLVLLWRMGNSDKPSVRSGKEEQK